MLSRCNKLLTRAAIFCVVAAVCPEPAPANAVAKGAPPAASPVLPPIAAGQALIVKGSAFYPEGEHSWTLAINADGRARSEISGPRSLTTVYDGKDLWRREKGAVPYKIAFAEKEVWLLRNFILAGLETRFAIPADSSPDYQLAGGSLHFVRSARAAEQLAFIAGNSPNLEGLVLEGSDRSAQIRIRIENIGDASAYQIDQVEISASRPDNFFAKPLVNDADFHFRTGVEPEIAVRKTQSGHLFIRPKLNGKDYGWFLFDSGAGFSGLNGEIARAEGFKSRGEIQQGGFGGPSKTVQIYQGGTLQLGPLVVEALFFHDVGEMRRASRLLGEPVAGVLGWDVFNRAVVEVDMREGKVLIHDPNTFRIDPQFRAPLYLHWQVPYASARAAGNLEGAFLIDTGAGSRGLVFPYFSVQRFGLLEGREGIDETAEGAGGKVAMLAGELEWFEIGGHRTSPAPTSFSLEEDFEGDLYGIGILGGAVVEPFRIVLDYGRSEVGFIPREESSRPPISPILPINW